jgi:protein TonB
MVVMGSVVILVLVGGVVSGLGKANRVLGIMIDDSVHLSGTVDPPPPPPPPPPRVVQPQVAMKSFTVPLIVRNEVNPNDRPPENKDLDQVRIGLVNKDGIADVGTPGPPATDGVVSSVVTGPKKSEDESFIPIEKEAEFPGGAQAWFRFLSGTLRYPDQAIDKGIQGTVTVQFIVDVDGRVSDVTVVSGPEEGGLREEAVRVIKSSGKWVPALQNGRWVRARRVQPVIFQQVDRN